MPGPLYTVTVQNGPTALPARGKSEAQSPRRVRLVARCVRSICHTGSPPQEPGKARKAPRGTDGWAWEVMGEREWAFQAEGTALVMAGRSRASLQFSQEPRAYVGERADEKGLAFLSPALGYPKKLEECVHCIFV